MMQVKLVMLVRRELAKMSEVFVLGDGGRVPLFDLSMKFVQHALG